MSIRKCTECRIRKQNECKWVNERKMKEIGRCVIDPKWGGACATCSKSSGTDPGKGYISILDVCQGCLANTRKGTHYFPAWSKRR